MRHALAASALLLLAACQAHPAQRFPWDEASPSSASASSAAADVETGTGDDAVTLEPFVDPLAPVALTGSVTVEERSLSGGTLEVGSARARLAMDVFLNVESPYAREFQRARMPGVVSRFVDAGTLRVRFHILPIQKYAGSAESARTIECATAQGKGYPALDALFREQRTTLTQEDVTELELDAMLFLSCFQTQSNDPLAPARAAAERHGVTLVPSYVIDGDLSVGLPTEADLVGAIRAAL